VLSVFVTANASTESNMCVAKEGWFQKNQVSSAVGESTDQSTHEHTFAVVEKSYPNHPKKSAAVEDTFQEDRTLCAVEEAMCQEETRSAAVES